MSRIQITLTGEDAARVRNQALRAGGRTPTEHVRRLLSRESRRQGLAQRRAEADAEERGVGLVYTDEGQLMFVAEAVVLLGVSVAEVVREHPTSPMVNVEIKARLVTP